MNHSKKTTSAVLTIRCAILFTISVFPSYAQNDNQQQFFANISALCNQAFAGKVTVDTATSKSFSNKKLIIHIAHCDKQQIRIPFYVGADASRTWLINKTEHGLSLKHDHRHKDGSADVLTMYGGHTEDSGWPQLQSFPADDETKQLFIDQQIPESIDNTWRIIVYKHRLSYQMTRPGRAFQVDFDLTKPIPLPPPPWRALSQ